MHAVCAAFFKTPELAIDETEAKLVSEAAANVAKHYDVLPDPKTQAWINLAMVMGGVYGPRIYVIWNKPKQAPGPPGAAPMQPAGAMPDPGVVSFLQPGRA